MIVNTWWYGAAEEGGPQVEGDAGEPDDKHPEGHALGAVLEDLERVLADLLRQDRGVVQHAGQQVDLQIEPKTFFLEFLINENPWL